MSKLTGVLILAMQLVKKQFRSNLTLQKSVANKHKRDLYSAMKKCLVGTPNPLFILNEG